MLVLWVNWIVLLFITGLWGYILYNHYKKKTIAIVVNTDRGKPVQKLIKPSESTFKIGKRAYLIDHKRGIRVNNTLYVLYHAKDSEPLDPYMKSGHSAFPSDVLQEILDANALIRVNTSPSAFLDFFSGNTGRMVLLFVGGFILAKAFGMI